MSERCNVLLVFPKFAGRSFWSMNAACEISGARWPSPPLGLVTVAALLPGAWTLRLVDRNTAALTDADIDWADMVMIGGMIPQRADALGLIERVKARGKTVVVGGPDATSSPHVFAAADFRVIGEAEGVIDDFVAAWRAGARRGDFTAEKYSVDVTRSPVPRFDLLNREDYFSVSVQFSRGCPFTCEFCDIIELFGRTPRAKTIEQMLTEIETLYAAGHRGVIDFVDDNLIGNKKAVKAFLPHLAAWQRERGYPFEFATEASINLADDDELLRLMSEANFKAIFVGIETPDADLLTAMRKKQNTRRDLADSVKRIYRAGIAVHAGFILGFDEERDGIADDMVACIEATAIPVCMVGLLTALPNTQLSRRLEREGRLDPAVDYDFVGAANRPVTGDQCTAGLNYETHRPRRDILADYRRVLDRIYEPDAYFRRVRAVARAYGGPRLDVRAQPGMLRRDLLTVGRLVGRFLGRERRLIRPFLGVMIECLWRNPRALRNVVSQTIMYFDAGPFARQVIEVIDAEIARIDAGLGRRPARTPATVSALAEAAV